ARLQPVRHAPSWASGLSHAATGKDLQADRLPEARRHSDLRPSVVGVPLQYEPCGEPTGPPARAGRRRATSIRARHFRRPFDPLLPGRRLRVGWRRARSEIRRQLAELRPLQDLRHQRPQRQYHLGPARGRRRPQLSEYVSRGVQVMIERSGPWDEEMLKGFTAPRSPLGVAALVPPPPWHFAGDVLAVEFWNDPDLSLKSFRWVSNLTRNVRGTPSHFSQTTNLPRRTMSISTPPDIKVA